MVSKRIIAVEPVEGAIEELREGEEKGGVGLQISQKGHGKWNGPATMRSRFSFRFLSPSR